MLAEKFRHKDGPFFQSLDCALATLHVERQAYHGGTFVGNHVHNLLKVLHKSFNNQALFWVSHAVHIFPFLLQYI